MRVAQVHERSLQGDFLMALLKDVVQDRRARGIPPLKVRFLPLPAFQASQRLFPSRSNPAKGIYGFFYFFFFFF